MDEIDERNTDPRHESGWAAFMRVMRYVSVGVITLALFVIMLFSMTDNDIWVLFVIFALVNFYVSIPLIACWLHSFARSLFRRTRTDRILLYFHIADMLMIGVSILMMLRPEMHCDADYMEKHYKEYGSQMREVAREARRLLPDSTDLVIEFGSNAPEYDIQFLSDKQLKHIEDRLDDVDCIGIETDNYGLTDYTRLRFKRQGMGMYSYRFYNRALTLEEQDSINEDGRFIVYDDSTVFEYGGGVFGPQYFMDKEEFLKRKANVGN